MCLAIPGRVVEITGGEGFDKKAVLDYDGVRQEASLAYLPETQIGDYLLVHVGFALTRLDPEEAERVLAEIRELTTPEPPAETA